MKIRILIIYCFLVLLQAPVVAQHDSTYNVFQSMKHLNDKEFKAKKAHLDSLYQTVSVNSAPQQVKLLPSNFKDRYKDDTAFNYERDKTDVTFWKRLKSKVEEFFKKMFGLASDYNLSGYNVIIVKVLAVILVLVALYFVVRLVMKHSGSWLFQKKDVEIEIDINNIEQLIEKADFALLINEYEHRGEMRQSIRLHYLWLLQDLNEKGLIAWHPDKTNSDYLYELKRDDFKEDFRYLSYLFNHIWYGEFSINEDEYGSIKSIFMAYRRKGVING